MAVALDASHYAEILSVTEFPYWQNANKKVVTLANKG